MKLDLANLPPWVKIELTKESLLAFGDHLLATAAKKSTTDKDVGEILTIDEAAKFLKLAKQTIYQLTSKRAIPFYKRNKRIYFKRSELLAWLDEGKQDMQVEFDDEVRIYLQNRKK